ncbi:aryl-sulfate sulfotransferase [Chitinophagales bacterium]|nr:aryl-sulfate sulfotransferase [Chitinophagales bacterium]
MKNAIFIIISAFCVQFCFAQDQTVGLFVNAPDAYNGYTLMSNNEITYLIDNCGQVVQTWESDYKTGHAYYLYPNGDLLRAGKINGDFDAGGVGGIIELFDWEGNIKWSYKIASPEFQAHHDLELLPNGNFLCLVWELIGENEAQAAGREVEGHLWSEAIWEIEIKENNQAEIVWEWSVWDHLVQDVNSTKPNFGVIAENPGRLNVNATGDDQVPIGDWLHLNGLSYNADFDQIAISANYLDEIYVIDHSTTTAEAASNSGGDYGKGGDFLYRFGNPQMYNQGSAEDQVLNGQHSIDWAPKGTDYEVAFTVYNNDHVPMEESHVLIFNNPADENGHYTFTDGEGYGDDSIIRSYTYDDLYSSILSSVQVLPNNELLICQGEIGHVFSVNENDEIIWDYVYPVNRNGGPSIQGGTPQFNSLFNAVRYSPDFAGFEGKDLSPGAPIELLPIDNGCSINWSGLAKELQENAFSVLSNPVRDELQINSIKPESISFRLVDLNGRLLLEDKLEAGLNSFNARSFPEGFFILKVGTQSQLILKVGE